MKAFFSTLWHDESGQDLAEYVLLLVLIALVIIGAIGLFRDAIAEAFNDTTEVLQQRGEG